MTVDPAVVPGLLLLTAELAALAAVGYVIVRVVLRQDDERMALAQGLVVGLALWGLITNFVLYVVPGLAGAAVGWGLTLAIGAVLAWRAPGPISPRPRTVAALTVAALAIFWAALASRQLLGIQDPHTNLGLAATIRAGGFPPELFWHPGTPANYHYGVPLLVGTLTPPVGPDLAFVNELLGAYGWTSFVLIVTMALLQRASLASVLVAAPLLLGPGLWTFLRVGPGLLQLPIPAGLPEAGLRASLADIYWPTVALPQSTTHYPWGEILPNVWKPAFTLGYALAFVVLERASRAAPLSWPAAVALAGLVGFIGVLATTLAPVVLVVWAGLAALRLVRSRQEGSALGRGAGRGRGWLRGAVQLDIMGGGSHYAGLTLAGLLLLGGSGLFTTLVDGAASSGLSMATSLHSDGWHLLGTVERRPGGVALLGVGPVVVAAVAVLLARRDPLVLALATGACLLALAWLLVTYPPVPRDVNRLAGHARNLAMVGLLLALASRLPHQWSGRWRHAVGVLLVGLIVWPTLVSPIRSLGLALANGVQLANAGWVQTDAIDHGVETPSRRYQLPRVSGRIANYLRENVPVDARVLATEPPYWNVSFATGHPNAAGIDGELHLIYFDGAAYVDAVHFLEPHAFRRLGIEYIHATDEWRRDLPARAAQQLDDPRLFELLVQDSGEALYRARPAFLELDASPHPASFEALRALPSSLTIYLHPQTSWWSRIRIASALPDARLMGAINLAGLHLRSPLWPVEPLGANVPDLVVLPARVDPWMFPAGWRPIWRNEAAVVYASPSAAPPIMTLPDIELAPVSVRVTDARLDQGHLTFTATYGERAPERWTSQDWLLVPLLESPLGIPVGFVRHERGPAFAKWFDGLLSSGSAATTHTYRLDLSTSALEVRNDLGAFTPLPASADDFGPGTWALVIRLRHEWQPNHWRDAAFIPVLRIRISEAGEIAVEVYDDAREN